MEGWSVDIAGSVADVCQRLKEYSDKLTGQVRTDYDAALHYLIGCVTQNERLPGEYGPTGVHLAAAGTSGESRQYHRSCAVVLEPLYDASPGGAGT
jgi:hypothetical protein